jgi:hypothetical protein
MSKMPSFEKEAWAIPKKTLLLVSFPYFLLLESIFLQMKTFQESIQLFGRN